MMNWRTSSEFAEWLAAYNHRHHADLTTANAPDYLIAEFLSDRAAADMQRDEVAQLTAENATLRAQLAEAEAALENIAGVTMSMVVNTQHLADERGRIAREYLRKHNPTT